MIRLETKVMQSKFMWASISIFWGLITLDIFKDRMYIRMLLPKKYDGWNFGLHHTPLKTIPTGIFYA